MANVLRGLLMGGADIVPGVSGGTVALILGIYENLVTSISRFDRRWIALLRSQQWSAAATHVDLRFLITLGGGILLGIITLGSVMNHLLTSETRSSTLAALFGALLASCWLVGKIIQPCHRLETVLCLILGLASGVLTYGLASMTPYTTTAPSPAYLFLCGMIGICAMILPGVSGALMLLVLGVYVYLTDYLKALSHGTISWDTIWTVLVFGSGCAVGLLGFSKLLRWLLAVYKSLTMSVMCGLMLGALKKIWPFQLDLSPEIHEIKYKQYKSIWPDTLDGHLFTCIALGIFGFVVILSLDWVARRPSKSGTKNNSMQQT